MTQSLSFLTSLDTPSKLTFSAEFSGEEGAGNEGFDGFADLLDQLVQIAPVQSDSVIGADVTAGERQALDGTGNETGNILPVLPIAVANWMPVQADPIIANDAGVSGSARDAMLASARIVTAAPAEVVELPVGRLDTARLVDVAPETPAPAPAPAAGQAQAMPGSDPAREQPAAAIPLARLVAQTPVAQTSAAPNAIAAAAQNLGGTPISAITIQPALAEEGETSAPAVKDLPVTASDTARRILSVVADAPAQRAAKPSMPAEAVAKAASTAAPIVAGEAKRSDAKTGPAMQASPVAQLATSKTETAADTARPVEAVQASARIVATPDAARPVEPVFAATPSVAASTAPMDAVTRAADLARSDAFSAIDNIARMVDRLSAGRDFGAMPAAAIAVMHKEFGELSIAIDRVSDTLQVEVAAKDGEAQRALAAAMASDRAAAIAGDRSAQRGFEVAQTQNAANTNTNSGSGSNSGGQSSAGSDRAAADTAGQAASNNAQSQRGEGQGQRQERARFDGQPLDYTRSAPASDRQPTGDDGRYA